LTLLTILQKYCAILSLPPKEIRPLIFAPRFLSQTTTLPIHCPDCGTETLLFVLGATVAAGTVVLITGFEVAAGFAVVTGFADVVCEADVVVVVVSDLLLVVVVSSLVCELLSACELLLSSELLSGCELVSLNDELSSAFELSVSLTSLPQAVIILTVSTAARTAAVILFFKLFTLPFYWTLILFIESMPTSEQIREIAPVNSRSVQPTFLQKSTPLMLKYL
jgi:hypothetical protein